MAAVLYCRDPLSPRRVDPHFAAEAAAVTERGGVVGKLDHDAAMRGDVAEAVATVPRDLGAAWYRGWMLPVDRYRAVAEAVADRGVHLCTTAAEYRRAHELPGWYEVFAELTPASAWFPSRPGELPALTVPFGGKGIVKDYVKSRKHEWHEACYVPDLADTARLTAVARRMVELQGDFLAGGVVVRAYEPFTGPEARVWWLDGEPVFTGAHPDTPDEFAEPDLTGVRAAVAALGCRFVTTDLAARADGVWRVVEVGDGQVSDLPASADPGALVEALLAATERRALAE
ncbi:ATP-grasp domain-containing protein [Amycolatopsis sp. CA-230715]|uniref:ATP-grasp domain-containing protein n=1 Tax=Amycolatopsis sp. CA-230715 TaxID=2745196 RepID=UPI001C038152|nr:ATP-grasp domain-containing protein [Amycolatopsis sp. CA-230715]QWF83480.1 hypothetical protein HUW46_06921 [Amycolatopsis sp. CA-230715]